MGHLHAWDRGNSDFQLLLVQGCLHALYTGPPEFWWLLHGAGPWSIRGAGVLPEFWWLLHGAGPWSICRAGVLPEFWWLLHGAGPRSIHGQGSWEARASVEEHFSPPCTRDQQTAA